MAIHRNKGNANVSAMKVYFRGWSCEAQGRNCPWSHIAMRMLGSFELTETQELRERERESTHYPFVDTSHHHWLLEPWLDELKCEEEGACPLVPASLRSYSGVQFP